MSIQTFRQFRQLTRAAIMAGALFGMAATVVPTMATAAESSEQASATPKVLYHISDAQGQALAAVRSMRNHLDTASNTDITVVAHGDGIEFLMTDYEDADTVGPLIADLSARGVVFEVCEITIETKGYSPDDFVMEADFTPSGVVRITELQNEQNYAYIKP